MGKWTRRTFIGAGVVAGGGLVVGVLIRPGYRTDQLVPLVASDDEILVSAWLKIGADNTLTAIVPHSEMGQGAQTALTQMLADELDARWDDVRFLEAPALDEYANWALAKGYVLGGVQIPSVLVPTEIIVPIRVEVHLLVRRPAAEHTDRVVHSHGWVEIGPRLAL